jgi:hypothetical protein
MHGTDAGTAIPGSSAHGVQRPSSFAFAGDILFGVGARF